MKKPTINRDPVLRTILLWTVPMKSWAKAEWFFHHCLSKNWVRDIKFVLISNVPTHNLWQKSTVNSASRYLNFIKTCFWYKGFFISYHYSKISSSAAKINSPKSLSTVWLYFSNHIFQLIVVQSLLILLRYVTVAISRATQSIKLYPSWPFIF